MTVFLYPVLALFTVHVLVIISINKNLGAVSQIPRRKPQKYVRDKSARIAIHYYVYICN
jgi:hypothetical protein